MTEPKSLTPRSWRALAQFIMALGLIIFLCAWDLRLWQGWAFLAVFGLATVWTTAALLKRDPALVERRMQAGPAAEGRPQQKLIQTLNMLIFLALIALPALDHRFGWSHAPTWVAIAGDVMVAAGFWGIYQVFRANSFASATVAVNAGQTLISTGPYGIVRHPMYAAAIPLVFGGPLAMQSYWGTLPAFALMAGIIWRLFDEERLLAAELPGYDDYRRKVSFRLLPGVF